MSVCKTVMPPPLFCHIDIGNGTVHKLIKETDWKILMATQEKIKVIVGLMNRDHLYFKTNICIKYEGPSSILSVVIIWTKFGLYIIKLKATVTLTFHGLISKSIGIIYTSRQMCVPNLTYLGQFCI